jgi:hypothetical protein
MRAMLCKAILGLALVAEPAAAREAALTPLDDGRLTVAASSGDQDIQLIFDTGASRTLFSADAAARLGMGLSGGPMALLRGPGGVEARPTYRAPGIVFAQAAFAPADGPVLTGSVADGVLGADLMRSATVEFDGPAGRVTLHKDARRFARWDIVPAVRTPGGLTLVEVSVAGAPAIALLDTGAARSVANGALAARLTCSEPAASVAGVDGAARGARGCEPASVAALGVHKQAALTASDLALFESLGLKDKPALILGLDVLRDARFVLDGPSGGVFAPPATALASR